MSDGATQNGGTQAASTGEAAAVTGAGVAATATATATAAPAAQTAAAAAAPAAPAVPLPAAVPAAVVVPAAVAVAAPAAAADADCKPVKKKAHHDHDKKDGEEEHARAPGNDEDQNLSQPAEGCVLPQTGEAAAAPAAEAPAGTPVYDDGTGGGISSGLLIGAGVLAAVGIGVLALSGDDDEEQNAPPVANADTATVAEGATLNGSVATNDTDPNNDPLTFALTGAAPAGLTFNANGTYVFDANNAAYNSLAAGATQVLSIPYSVSDGRGGTANSTLTITVTGTNDAPVAVNDTAAATEGGAVVTGNLSANDSDPDTGATRTYTLAAPVAGLTVNANGTFSFDPTNAAYNGLAQGQTQVVTANINISDGAGGTATSTLAITVTGANDAPVAVADVASGTEGNGNLTGSVAANDTDPDTGAVLTYSLNAPVAGLTLDSNGTYTFDLNDPAYDALNTGQTRVVVANYTVRDAQGATSTSTLTITVNGTTDGPIAVADTAAATEGGAVVTGNISTNDVNTGASGTVTYTLATPVAGLTLNPNGTFSFDPNNAAYDALNTGQTQTVVANTIATDASGRTSASTLTITVTGLTDVPTVSTVNLDIDDDANLNTVRVFDGGAGAVNFTDSDDVANLVVINNFGQDDFITFDAAFTGNGRPSFASGDFDNDNVADDLRITTNINGVVSDIVLTNVVTAGALVFDEATADAAVAGTDNFRSSATPTTPTTPVGATAQALEADDNTNPNDYRTFNAASGSFRFTDDADAANNAIIVGLGNNDQIVLEAGNTYSFTSGDRDGDGLANDITVTINKGGVVSELILKDAVVNNNLVFSEATAEQALGGIDYFSFA